MAASLRVWGTAAVLFAAYVCLPAAVAEVAATAAAGGGWKKGIVFGCDEWTSPDSQCGSDASRASLRALAYTGADHVRIV